MIHWLFSTFILNWILLELVRFVTPFLWVISPVNTDTDACIVSHSCPIYYIAMVNRSITV